jgi:hypothetical protein
MLVHPVIKYAKANTFFVDKNDHYYIQFQYRTPNAIDNDTFYELFLRNKEMNESIYADYYDDAEPIMLISINNQYKQNDYSIILTNAHAYNYISSVIKDFTPQTVTSDIIFLLPNNMNSLKMDEIIEQAKETVPLYTTEFTYSIHLYDPGIHILGIDYNIPEKTFTLQEDPIIVYNMTHPHEIRNAIYLYANVIMYKFTSNMIDDIVTKYSLEREISEITNVYELYNHFWTIIIAGFSTMLLLSILSIIFVTTSRMDTIR